MFTSFHLSDQQRAQVRVWCREQDTKITAPQRVAGAYTYCFTPTGLGVAVTVRNAVTGDEVVLTGS
jgi:hypothetical protein